MAFATADDIATRLMRALTGAETEAAELLLDGAASLIALALDKDDDWVDDLNPVPTPLHFVSIEIVARAINNPSGAESQREQLGQYSYSVTWGENHQTTLYLTKYERAMVRRAVFGSPTLSARTTPPIEEDYSIFVGS